ncbi:hypothetical protein FRC11_005178, partial [Ceratobasidium sp. 423]
LTDFNPHDHSFGMGDCGLGFQINDWLVDADQAPDQWPQDPMPSVLGPSPDSDSSSLEPSSSQYGTPEAATTASPLSIHSPATASTRFLHLGPSSSAPFIVPWMIVPELHGTRQEITDFIEQFQKELDLFKRVLCIKRVVCSRCGKEYPSKPSMLERHLHSHFGVKTYKCRVCEHAPFTTRDQAVVHAWRSHGVNRAAAEQVVQKLE